MARGKQSQNQRALARRDLNRETGRPIYVAKPEKPSYAIKCECGALVMKFEDRRATCVCGKRY